MGHGINFCKDSCLIICPTILIMLLIQALFTAFTLGCALANDFATLCVLRLFVGIGASSPISVVGG
jgi:MFS family permease